MALTVLSAWIAFVAWRERRRWLLTWSSIYGAVAVFMTLVTYIKVHLPFDPPDSGILARHISRQMAAHYMKLPSRVIDSQQCVYSPRKPCCWTLYMLLGSWPTMHCPMAGSLAD